MSSGGVSEGTAGIPSITRQKIIEKEPKSLMEPAAGMGYKGITAKLSRTISSMERKGLIEKTAGNGNRVKYVVSGKRI